MAEEADSEYDQDSIVTSDDETNILQNDVSSHISNNVVEQANEHDGENMEEVQPQSLVNILTWMEPNGVLINCYVHKQDGVTPYHNEMSLQHGSRDVRYN